MEANLDSPAGSSFSSALLLETVEYNIGDWHLTGALEHLYGYTLYPFFDEDSPSLPIVRAIYGPNQAIIGQFDPVQGVGRSVWSGPSIFSGQSVAAKWSRSKYYVGLRDCT